MQNEGPPRRGYFRQYGAGHHRWNAFFVRFVVDGMSRPLLEAHRRRPEEEFPLESDEHLETVVGGRSATSLIMYCLLPAQDVLYALAGCIPRRM